MSTAPLPADPARELAPELVDMVRRSVREVLEQSPAYLDSTPSKRKELASKLVRVGLAGAKLLQDEHRETERIAAASQPTAQPDSTLVFSQSVPAPLATAQSAGEQTNFDAARKAGDTFRAVREAIDFPSYVSSLISGVFQAITQSSIKQVEGLINLLDHVGSPAEEFANAEVQDDNAAAWAASRFSFLQVDGGELTLRDDESIQEHRDEIRSALAATDQEVASVDEDDLAGTLLPLVRRKLGLDRQTMLATMIQLGLQRIVVDEGKLHASMDMRVDTRSAAQQEIDDQQKLEVKARAKAKMSAGIWGASASLATNFSMIHSDHRSTKEELDTRAGLRSSVDLAFRTEQVPLDRLATKKARVHLDSIARVPVDVTDKSILDTSAPAPARPALAPPKLKSAPADSSPAPPKTSKPTAKDSTDGATPGGTTLGGRGGGAATGLLPGRSLGFPLGVARGGGPGAVGATAGTGPRVDIWHEVPLVPQLTGMSCWAAAAAMLIGWRDCIDVDPAELARGSGRWREYQIGITPKDIGTLARVWDFKVFDGHLDLDFFDLTSALDRHGPLWVGEASPGLHVVVVAGAAGDGDPATSTIRIADPWPEGRGERYTITFAEFRRSLAAAAELSGAPAKILQNRLPRRCPDRPGAG